MKSRRTLVLAILAASVLLAPQIGTAEEVNLLNGSKAIQAASYTYYTVQVDRTVMHDAAIIGHVQASGGRNDIEITVFTESDFLNWKNGHTNSPVYNSGRVTAADVRASVTESGTYYVVLSNTFSMFTPKTVEGSLRLAWTPPPPPPSVANDLSPDTRAIPVTSRIVVFLTVFAALIGGWCLWSWARQRNKAAASVARPHSPAPSVSASDSARYCAHCGSPAASDARFCPRCGMAATAEKAV